MLIVLVIFQYVGLSSNETLVKSPNAIYYAVYLSWYKYAFLLLEWLLLSNLLFNICTHGITQINSTWCKMPTI
jgi:hypothetical protein